MIQHLIFRDFRLYYTVEELKYAKGYAMKVFLRRDVENVGMQGDIVNVSDGFANNYLLPRRFAIRVDAHNEAAFKRRLSYVQEREKAVASKAAMTAERIASLQVTLKRKTHDESKLYGSVTQQEIAQALQDRGISVAKNQVRIEKTIKTTGTHTVTIKLSRDLQPQLQITVVPA